MDRSELERTYEEAGSLAALARQMGICVSTARKRLRAHRIEIRKTGFKSPKTVTHSGPDHTNWKGGTYRHSGGYVYQYAPEHPDAASAKGYVLQHRLVMELKLGRPLLAHEIVHHVNEVKDDNRPENLELTNRSLHMQGHKAGVARSPGGQFLG